MAKEKGEHLIANNKKARHDYLIIDTFEAGIVLKGTEVKSLRMGRASLIDGYAHVDNGEVWLEAVHIPEYSAGTWTNHATKRKRKLLLHKKEISKLWHKTREGGHTIVPLKLYFSSGKVKVEIALAKGKKEYDKRHALKERQDNREAARAVASRKYMGE